MKTARLLASCLLILPLAGPVLRFGPKYQENREESQAQRLRLLAELRATVELFRAGHYDAAAARYRDLAARGAALHETTLAARTTANLGGCLMALHRYQPALETFLEARALAERVRDSSTLAAIDANIASLYTQNNDLEAAARWIQGARERMTNPQDRREYLPQLLLQLGAIRARQRRLPEALALFRQGTDDAARAVDLNLYTTGWNRLGEELLLQHDLAGAEPPLLEAYRVRKLHHLQLYTSYRSLGRLRLEQGDLGSASMLLDRAVALASGPRDQVPTWDLYDCRGRVRLAQGRLREALDDLRTAVRLGRAWRWSAVPGDSGRIGEEGWLDHVNAAFVEAGNRLYRRTGDPALPRETFEVLEENRASSLRLLHAARSGVLPAEYWEAIAALQAAEVRALRSGSAQDQESTAAARAAVARLEEASPVSRPASAQGTLLGRARKALDGNTALFSFEVGEQISWLWAVDREGIELRALPPRADIARLAQAAAGAVRENRPIPPGQGSALYNALFGGLTSRLRHKQRWLVALDGPLYDVPLPALAVRDGGSTRYLVELHTVQVIPGVGWWLEAGRRAAPLAPLFVGIGDPVYNTADSRLASSRVNPGQTLGFPRLLASGISLPRLVGSASELTACARAWGGERRLLTGAAANRRNLVEQLQRNPSVVHFATHVLETKSEPPGAAIALSLEGSEPALVPPGEIAQWHIRAGLVVLSGCHSAAGAVLPGTGLLGLTRAWLAAGAVGVVGSLWDTTDDSGPLFSAFYRHLRSGDAPSPAQALRAAQLEMLHLGDWHAGPRYWGAYFAMGIDSIQ